MNRNGSSKGRKGRTWAALALCVGLGAGCTASGFDREVPVPKAPSFTAHNGLVVWEVALGDGAEAVAGSTVLAHFIARVEGQPLFDSTYARGKPERLRLGGNETIEGLEQGLLGMRVGGKRKLLVPPELGFGDEGNGDLVKPGATLELEVELVSVED